MKMPKRLPMLAVTAFFFSGVAFADTITVPNFSFENEDGWLSEISNTSYDYAGFADLTSNYTDPLPDGNRGAYINLAGQEVSAGFFESEMPLVTTQLGASYTLTVAIGKRIDTTFNNGSIELILNGNVVGSNTFDGSQFAYDSWTDLDLQWQAVSVGDLKIRLTHSRDDQSPNFESQLNFDNVRLSVAVVPEPDSLLVIGSLFGLAGLKRRRN